MSNKKYKKEIQALLDEIIVDAYGDVEQLWAFIQAFENNIPVPADVFVMGLPCILIDFKYDGNERRGLTAKCKRDDGSEHEVSVAEITFPHGSMGGLYVDAYRRWMGLEPIPPVEMTGSRKILKHKAQAEDIDLHDRVDLIVVSVKQNAVRCCIPGNNRIVTLKTSLLWSVVPGEIITVQPEKQWYFSGHPYISGELISSHLDINRLNLVPLRLEKCGTWNPEEELYCEESQEFEDWKRKSWILDHDLNLNLRT